MPPVHRRNRNVQGIYHGVGRQRPRRDEGLGESGSLLAQGQERNVLQRGDTARCRFSITGLCLLDDWRGNKKGENRPPGFPPPLGKLLVCPGGEITTWAGCGKARKRRFQVAFGFIGGHYPTSS